MPTRLQTLVNLLALFDEAHRGAEVMLRLARKGRCAADVCRAPRESTHHGDELAPTSSEMEPRLEAVELFISGC